MRAAITCDRCGPVEMRVSADDLPPLRTAEALAEATSIVRTLHQVDAHLDELTAGAA